MLFLSEIQYQQKKSIKALVFNTYGIGKLQSSNISAKLGQNRKGYTQGTEAFNAPIRIKDTIFKLIKRRLGLTCGRALNYLRSHELQQIYHLKNYHAKRHLLCLPVRGQRTHSNAQTQKHKRRNRKRTRINTTKKPTK